MIATTRAPRLLVKVPAAPVKTTFDFGSKSLTVGFDRLLDSIWSSCTVGMGAAAEAEWYLMSAGEAAAEVNAWDLCHHLVTEGFGVAGLNQAQFAEPDLEQQWITGTPVQHAMSIARPCDNAADPDPRLPKGSGLFWFRDSEHSQLEEARTAVGEPLDRVRIAHLDTGYDPNHKTKPLFLRTELGFQKNFVNDGSPDDASDHTSSMLTNLGHGTGTLSILAGAAVNGVALGGAPFLEVIPIRVANSVVLFKNSAIARGFDYVHGLFGDTAKRAHVITMSMGVWHLSVGRRRKRAVRSWGIYFCHGRWQ